MNDKGLSLCNFNLLLFSARNTSNPTAPFNINHILSPKPLTGIATSILLKNQLQESPPKNYIQSKSNQPQKNQL
uniref:Auxin response factor n=1 Tax=Rhizophora mucronata TaxID=61149 RepID=A0A2P2M9R4_RHIMU